MDARRDGRAGTARVGEAAGCGGVVTVGWDTVIAFQLA
jgi:hypothetical protein